MRTAMLTVLAAALSMGAAGGEPKQTKAERIASLRQEIARTENDQKNRGRALELARRRGDEKQIEFRTRTIAEAQCKLEQAKTDLAVLTGQITRVSAEAKVKAAEEALEKAAEAEKPAKQTALDAARKELAAVVKFEGEF